MQKSRQKYFSDRVLYYASFAIQQQSMIAKEKLEKISDEEVRKRWNYQINKVYVVCVLNYVMDLSRPEKYRWDIVRMDRELKIPFSETLVFKGRLFICQLKAQCYYIKFSLSSYSPSGPFLFFKGVEVRISEIRGRCKLI